MFPNAINTSLVLLNIVGIKDSLGNKKLLIKDSKEVVGILKSITSKEYQTSMMINLSFDLKVLINALVYDGSKYVLLKDKIYKIERTYLNGMFLELYLSLTDLNKDELHE